MQIISNPSGVKSVQRGSATLSSVGSLNVTIAAVNLSKSYLVMNSGGGGGATAADQVMVTGKLNTATQLSFYRPTSTGTAIVQWEVVENA